MERHDVLLIGNSADEWLSKMEQSASSMGIRFVAANSLQDGLDIVNQYHEILDGIVIDASAETSPEAVNELTAAIQKTSSRIVFFRNAGTDPAEILTQLRQALGNKKPAGLLPINRNSAFVSISELPATLNTRANYVAEFAYRLHACFVARNEPEEREAQSVAIRWHHDLFAMLSLLDSDMRINLRFVSMPRTGDKQGHLAVWIVAGVYAQTGAGARMKAETAANRLEDFLMRGASCDAGAYNFVPARSRKRLKTCLKPFQPAATLEFRHKSIRMSPGASSLVADRQDGIRIALPARSTYLRTLQRLTDVLSHQSLPAMLEIILRPVKLSGQEVEFLRAARNNLWKQESTLTYAEMQAAAFEMDELLRSTSQVFITECRLWYGGAIVPESLISTISREYHLPVSEITPLPAERMHDLHTDNEWEMERLASVTSLASAVELFRLPLPTRMQFRDTAISHPVFDYIPDGLPSTGPVLGSKRIGEKPVEVRISPEDLRRHVYVLGQTGTGKSTLLRSMINERIESGMGLCLIDPHGDLLSAVYTSLTKRDRSRTIVFDPTNVSKPLGLNMLEYDPSHPEQKTLLVNQMISIFDMLYDLHLTGGPIFEQYMRNAMLLVMDDPDHQETLVSVTRVFQESEYREDLVDRCKNSLVKAFWHEAMRTRGEAGLEYLTPYITSKLNQFVSNDYIYPIISQKKSGLDFRALIDSDTILLVKLSKGKLGEIGVRLLGMILFARLLLAALSRDDVQENRRTDFCLFVDEFQNFTSESVAQMLSEARKYRLNLVLANQTLGQLRSSILESVLGNVGSLVVFRPGINDCERLKPYVDPPFRKEEVLNLPNYVAIGKLLAQGIPLPPFVFNTIKPSTKHR